MMMLSELLRPLREVMYYNELLPNDASIYPVSRKSFAILHSSKSTGHFLMLFVFLLWWIFSPSLHPNWHQFTWICKYKFMSNQGCHLVSTWLESLWVSVLNWAIIAWHARGCVWWTSFSPHQPGVSFAFILIIFPQWRISTVPGVPINLILECLIGSDDKGGFSCCVKISGFMLLLLLVGFLSSDAFWMAYPLDPPPSS